MLYISKTMMSSRRRNKALPESLLGKKANPAPAYGQTETEAPQLFHEAYTRRNRLWLWEGSGPYENKCKVSRPNSAHLSPPPHVLSIFSAVRSPFRDERGGIGGPLWSLSNGRVGFHERGRFSRAGGLPRRAKIDPKKWDSA